ncbi:MAG: alpha/beta hydrolase [Maribacter sp.]|nr:alpha/beta hydrolase [Maribacter sp.]
MKIPRSEIHKDLRSSISKLDKRKWLLSRRWGFQLGYFLTRVKKGGKVKGLFNKERYIQSRHGGPDIRIRIYKPIQTTTKLPVLLYLHGGGYAIGCPEQVAEEFKKFIELRPCIIVAPDYRKSIKAPYPAAFDDCYDTLMWVNENADSLNAREGKIMIGGHSAGGGLTAAVTLKARDTQSVKIAFQMPFYPMIDDRQITNSSKFITPVWDAKLNASGWRVYLKDLKEQNIDIPTYAAPARNDDYQNFPPTITLVGGADPIYDETCQYVEALKKFNIPVKFKTYEGCFHGFEFNVPNSEIAKGAVDFTFDSYAEYYDKYIIENG